MLCVLELLITVQSKLNTNKKISFLNGLLQNIDSVRCVKQRLHNTHQI
jgi:hypothetical protein